MHSTVYLGSLIVIVSFIRKGIPVASGSGSMDRVPWFTHDNYARPLFISELETVLGGT